MCVCVCQTGSLLLIALRTTPLCTHPALQTPAPAQGVDYEGRAIVIIAVRNHISAKRDLRQMRLFSAAVLDSLVRGPPGGRRKHCSGRWHRA